MTDTSNLDELALASNAYAVAQAAASQSQETDIQDARARVATLEAQAADLTARVAALEAPPPAPASWPKGGTGLWSPGADIPVSANGLDMVISADWNSYQIKDFTAPTLSLIYQSPLSCDDRVDRFYGMSAQECIGSNWCLRDSAGAPAYSASYPHSVLADVGLVAYQDRWAQNAIAFMQARGMDGCQLDDVVAQLSGYAGVVVPKYQAGGWEAAMAACISNVGAKIRAAGLYTLGNVYKTGGWANTATFAAGMKAGLNGAMLEGYSGASDQLAAAATLLTNGVDAIGLDFNPTAAAKTSLLAVGPRALYMTP